MFEETNVVLVQLTWNNLHVSLMKGLRFVFVYRKTKFLFFSNRVLNRDTYVPVSIVNHKLLVNDKIIQCFSALENAFYVYKLIPSASCRLFVVAMLCLFKQIKIICTFLLRKARISYFRGYVCRKPKIFFLVKVCVLLRKKFPLKRKKYTVFMSSWKCVLRVNINILSFVPLKHYVWRKQCYECSNESKSFARFSYERPEYRVSGVMYVEKWIFFFVKPHVW